MIISTWNVRGLNNPASVVEVKKHIKNNKVHVNGLLETKVKTKIVVKLGKN